MIERRYRLPLIALWLCVVYFGLLTAFAFVNYHTAPTLLISDYYKDDLTKADLLAVRDDFGKVLWRGFILQVGGAIALLAVAIWVSVKRTPPNNAP
jgi:hypothetical protein